MSPPYFVPRDPDDRPTRAECEADEAEIRAARPKGWKPPPSTTPICDDPWAALAPLGPEPEPPF